MTTTHVEAIPPIGRFEAARLAHTEYERLAEQLRTLGPDDWTQPTDCPLWDVRAVAGHCVGMMDDLASTRSMLRRMRLATKGAKATGAPMVDAMSSQQVADTSGYTTDELIARAERSGPAAARWRAKNHPLLRRLPMKQEVDGRNETWRMAYLLDVILTRDPWMHRLDIARATDRDVVHTADHDGRIVADVVAEWARRHGAPFSLVLTGPAGGEFVGGPASGGASEHITMEATEFCRTLSGRREGTGVLAQEVPF